MDNDRESHLPVVDLLLPTIVAIALCFLPRDLAFAPRVATILLVMVSIPLTILTAALTPPSWVLTTRAAVRLIVVITIVGLAPALWPMALVYVATVTTAVSAVLDRTDGLYLVAAGAAGLAFTAAPRELGTWLPAVLLLLLMVFAVRRWTAEWRAARNETDRRFDNLIDTARMFFWEIDPSTGETVSVTGNTLGMLGYHPEEFAALEWTQIVPDSDDGFMAPPDPAGGDTGEEAPPEIIVTLIHADGRPVTTRQIVRRTAKGHLIGAVADVSDLTEATEALRYQAEHDALTGLANRFLFTSTLDALFVEESNGQGGSTADVGLILFDLDGFKSINDTLGHGIGDQVLTILADRFRNSLSEATLCARIGGDEFAILLTDDVTEKRAVEFANRLIALVENPLPLAGLRLSVSCSAGIALAPDHAANSEQILQRADIALYEAKATGEKVCVYASTPEEISVERLQLSTDIGSALDNGEFELWFQPKVDLRSGTTIGAEGLARWRHPKLGIVAPNRFLPLLGVSGDYQRFTDRVIEAGVEFAANCRSAGHPINVAVNLGSVSFLDTDLPSRIGGLLELHRVEPSALILEVTEDELLSDRDSSSRVFEALEHLGVQLSIDDFGTGYSSLTRLRALHIQEVKIDRSFVSGLGQDPEDWAIVRMTIQLARLLGKTVVAEGIEEEDQLAILRSLDCDAGQGFLFEKAVPAKQFLADLTAGRFDFGTLTDLRVTNPFFMNDVPGPKALSPDVSDGLLLDSAANDLWTALSEEEGRHTLLSGISAMMPIASWVKDSEARFVRANNLLARRLGFSNPDDIVGKTDFDVHEVSAARHYFAQDLEVLRTGQTMTCLPETQTAPDGKSYTVNVTKVPIKNRKGEVIGVVGFYPDADPAAPVPGGAPSAGQRPNQPKPRGATSPVTTTGHHITNSRRPA